MVTGVLTRLRYPGRKNNAVLRLFHLAYYSIYCTAKFQILTFTFKNLIHNT
jgi:hypothetical protein